MWTGHLQLLLVTIPVRVYSGLNSSENVHFHLLHRGCHQRIRQKLCCPVHGEIRREDTVRGCEFEKDRYVVLEETDLQKVRLETTHTIEILQFIRPCELDPVLLDSPYFIVPYGRIALEAYCVLQQAIERAGVVGVGRVALNGKEKLLVLRPAGRGLAFVTLRPRAEVRTPAEVFAGLTPPKLDPEQLKLAQKLIEQKTGHCEQTFFTDRYRTALLELIQNKVKGIEPVVAADNHTRNVVDLMDALRRSIANAQRSRARPTRTKIAA